MAKLSGSPRPPSAASESRADQERSRADRAEKSLEYERSRADALRDRLEAAKAELQQAQQTAEALRQADAERKAMGRLRRAWDGWKGR